MKGMEEMTRTQRKIQSINNASNKNQDHVESVLAPGMVQFEAKLAKA